MSVLPPPRQGAGRARGRVDIRSHFAPAAPPPRGSLPARLCEQASGIVDPSEVSVDDEEVKGVPLPEPPLLPTPSAVTFNARSLKLGRNMSDWLKWQETAACATIRFLLGLHDHVLIQETWAVSNDALKGALMSAFPGAHFAASSLSATRAGVAILSRAAVLRSHEPTIYSSDTRHGRGHLVSVLWRPPDGGVGASLGVRDHTDPGTGNWHEHGKTGENNTWKHSEG